MEALSREAISFYIKGDGFDKHIIYVDETLYVNDIGNLYIEYPFYANEVVSIDLEQPVEENNLAGNKKVYKLQSAAKNKYFLKAQLLGRETLNIQEINNDGMTILLVEQNAHKALQIADYAYIIEGGRIQLEGPAAEVRESDRVKEIYLGG